MATAIRLSIIGTNTLFRECLAVVLGNDRRYTVLNHSANLDQAADGLDPTADVVLVDLSRSRDAALRLVRTLTRLNVSPQVLTIGLERLEEDALRCMEAGAKGYVPIGSSMDDLHDALARLRRGQVAYSPEMTSIMFERLAQLADEKQRKVRADAESLTARESEILGLVARGLTNNQIAGQLSLSTHTVKNHLHNVLKKLQVRNRREAVRLALQQGLIDRRSRR